MIKDKQGSKDKQGTKGLEAAYSLKTPEDSERYYGEWAGDYDRDFAQTMGYVFPAHLVARFRAEGGTAMEPILDVGAGTGLVAEELSGEGLVIDAIDISREMLEVAGAKGLYRDRIVGDLTKTLPIPDASYGALISSGTFTSGHVGAEAFGELIRIARPGALFCLGINPIVWESGGFQPAFDRLVEEGAITRPERERVPIYEGAEHEHADDPGEIVVFRKR
ncbi:MAG: class I SAM-dependent methyltransferase [Paracoccaceae bacterium]|nr:class I SAM-dependent methyltransferase [Paracoccaceae bacterium]